MKKFYFLLMALCFFKGITAQNINFPDANFKAKLLLASPSNNIAKDLSGNFFKIDANDNGEIEVNESSQVTYLDISYLGNSPITSLVGISDFYNLVELTCVGNLLSSLDFSGLTSLRSLDCQSNQLTSLNVSGLTSLVTLNCNSNELTSLNINNLNSLVELSCNQNQISVLNLSNLPSLKILYCNMNLLSSLDINSLTNINDLDYGNNQIPSINLSNLINLKRLVCSNNQISSFSSITLNPSVNLTSLWCDGNQLTSLDLSNFSNLQELGCHYNQLTALNVSSFTNLLTLYCNANQLTSLDVSNLQQLVDLSIGENPITSIDIRNLVNLTNFYCDRTLIVEIDFSSSLHLDNLYIHDCSQLNRIFMKNGVINNTNNLTVFNLPNLQYICADEEEINSIQDYFLLNNVSGFTINSYCSFAPGGEFYTIQGNNKFDIDNNGCDAFDFAFQNLKFSISDGINSGTFISNTLGNYSMAVHAGTHTVTPILENPTYFNISPSNAIVEFPTQTSPFTQGFCVTANGVHPDLEVILTPTVPARPGFDAVYKLIYKNKGTNTQSGSVSLTFDNSKQDFVSSTPTTMSQAIGNLTWDFTNLQSFETREITLTVNVNSPMETPPVNGGDVLNYTASITSAATDETPEDNTFTLNQTVVNSFDPNDKTCLEGATITPSEVGKYVHYLIRFENNGTANAHNIVVKDMIDTAKFDINSLVPIKGSHSFVTNITSGNKVEFIFENINLPFDDANNDGYVAFKIKTKPTLVTGNTFSNSASIYFDYNFPIVTNTATTTIQVLSIQDFSFGSYFSLYPNPVKDIINIETKQNIEVSSISIYNQLGQLVLVVPNAQNVSKVDVSSLQARNYFIKINSDKGTSNAKFIKQ